MKITPGHRAISSRAPRSLPRTRYGDLGRGQPRPCQQTTPFSSPHLAFARPWRFRRKACPVLRYGAGIQGSGGRLDCVVSGPLWFPAQGVTQRDPKGKGLLLALPARALPQGVDQVVYLLLGVEPGDRDTHTGVAGAQRRGQPLGLDQDVPLRVEPRDQPLQVLV